MNGTDTERAQKQSGLEQYPMRFHHVNCQGYAFDLVPENGKMREFKRFCREFLSDKAFDQLISEGEDNSGVPSWMHIGYKHPQGTLQRRQALSMVHGKYYPMTE